MTLDPQAMPFPPGSFLGRFALACWNHRGVLLDVESGAFYRLNESALFLCRCFTAAATVGNIASQFSERYRLPLAQAGEALAAFLHQLEHPPVQPARNPIQFSEHRGIFSMQWQGRKVLEIEAQTLRVRRLSSSDFGADAAAQLLWAAPHLLTLQGRTVLHASAVVRDDQVVVFCGGTGVGKSTIAGILQRQGFTPAGEDLVLLSSDPSPQIPLEGEAHVRRWASEQAVIFENQGAIVPGPLASALHGPALPLGKLVFVRPDRHSHARIIAEPLDEPDTLLHLLENSFAELGQPGIWRQVFSASERLASRVPAERVQMPDGLDQLDSALAAYMRMQT